MQSIQKKNHSNGAYNVAYLNLISYFQLLLYDLFLLLILTLFDVVD